MVRRLLILLALVLAPALAQARGIEPRLVDYINKIVRRTRYRYDGASCGSPSAAPTNGLLTAADAYLPGEGNSPCGADWLTTTTSYGGVGGCCACASR